MTLHVKPITPAEASAIRETIIPNEVIKAFNELIVENLDGAEASIFQHAIVDRVKQKFANNGKIVDVDQIFKNKWLDVEPVFKKQGWKVTYDKPAYCEEYQARFVFRVK